MSKDKRLLRVTLRGYHLWAFEQVRLGCGGQEGEDSDALNHIIGRWLLQDREEAENEFGINREAWKRACGLNVTSMEKSRKRRGEE